MVVTDPKGTAKQLKDIPLDIHAKTGTAQSPGGDETNPHSWITSFAEINGRTIVVSINLEYGDDSYKRVVPLAKDIYSQLLQNKTLNES